MRVAVHSTDPAKIAPRVNIKAWANGAAFSGGISKGTTWASDRDGGIVISNPVGILEYYSSGNAEGSWECSTWTSPAHTLGFGATRLIPSWNSRTPPGTWLRVEIKVAMQDGCWTPWLIMGDYAFFEDEISRASYSPVAEPYGEVDTDTFLTYLGFAVRAYRARVTMCRRRGVGASPRLWRLVVAASAVPPRTVIPACPPGRASSEGIELSVPRYSQFVHSGHYEQYDGGGKSWCSAASTEMVIEYWGAHPREEDLSWVSPRYQDPQVAFAARQTYDYGYQGTGNWAFNTAYASHFGLDGEVLQLPHLGHLEQLIAHGVPVVTAQAFDEGEVTDANYGTAGHLWVVTGFTRDGDVIVNDPAGRSGSQVRRVLGRRQFENVWLRTFWERPNGAIRHNGGGVVYVIRPRGMKLPLSRLAGMANSTYPDAWVE